MTDAAWKTGLGTPTSEKHNRAIEEGRQANFNGFPMSSNPYRRDKKDCKTLKEYIETNQLGSSWDKGWMS